MTLLYWRTIKKLQSSVLTFLLLAVVSVSNGQTFDFKATEASAVVTGDQLSSTGFPSELVVWCNHWDYITNALFWSGASTWREALKYKSNVSFIKFYVDQFNTNTKFQTPYNYTYHLACHVYGYTDPADTVSVYTVTTDTLTINFNNYDENTPYQEINLKKYNNYYKLRVVIDAILEETSPGTLVAATLSEPAVRNFRVEASILSQCYDKKEYGTASPATAPIITAIPHPDENYLDLNWAFSTGSLTPVNYELEWTFVDDYSVNIATGSETAISSSSVGYDFEFNNTKVWLKDNKYRIPLVYPRGYVVYRVRPVRPDSDFYRYPIYGKWSLPGGDAGLISSLSSGFYYLDNPYLGDSLNWQYTTSFAEEGKYKNVASFYDGLLKARQSIARFNSSLDKLIATNSIYDYEGRLSIKTLPAPVKSSNFRLLHNVDLNAITNLPYRAADFDTGSLRYRLIGPLAKTALANIYYSEFNPDTVISRHQKFVPNAEGYPFVQTIFESGYDDRVSAIGGAGRKLQIGDSNYVFNTYANASQPLINSLFGINGGWNNFYTMTVNRDANQQYSMVVKDLHGKQMVSSLIGSGPSSATHALDEVLVIDSVHYKQDILRPDPGTQDIDTLTGRRSANVDFFNEIRAVDSVQYFYSFPPYQACPDQNIFVRAHYTASVSDQYGDVIIVQDTIIGRNGIDSVASPINYSTEPAAFAASVENYHITKTVAFSPWDVDNALDSFFVSANCFIPETRFVRNSVSSAVFPCPGETSLTSDEDDKCAKAKREMMQQLFPNAVYGKYTMIGDSMAGADNSIYTIIGCANSTRYCYSAYATQGGDSSMIIAKVPPYGLLAYRCFCDSITIPDTCVYNTTHFTNKITIAINGLDDSTSSIAVPFLSSGGMIGEYAIKGPEKIGILNGNIFSAGSAVGSIEQYYGAARKTVITLPITVRDDSFIAELHGNALTPAGDSFTFVFYGKMPAAHTDSTYVDYTSTLCHRRYQDTCTIPSLPDAIVIRGISYTGLRTMSPTAFTSIYREALAAGDYSIAEALLPLHPQYCELKNCFTDSFKAQLLGLPDWRAAQTLHLLYLDSIVAHDPLKDLMISSGLFPGAEDSLMTFSGDSMRLDSFIYMAAYCGCGDSIMRSECYNTTFTNEIGNHLLINDKVKADYFTAIIAIYLTNRQRFIDSLFKKDGNSCSHCAGARMTLVPSASIIPFPVYVDSPVVSYPWYPFGTTAFSGPLSSTSAYAPSERDSLLRAYHVEDSTLAMAVIDSIAARLANCITGIASLESPFRASLLGYYNSGIAPHGEFSYGQILAALHTAGITTSDICNPYMFSVARAPSVNGSMCMSDDYYNDLASFLQTSPIPSALSNLGTSYPYALDSDYVVQRDIARKLGNIVNVTIGADYDYGKQLYVINISAVGSTSAIEIKLHSAACSDIFSTWSPGTYSTNVVCINSDPTMLFSTGYVNNYSFIATITGTGGSTCRMTGWIERLETMNTADKEISKCVPCTQMRDLYIRFADTLAAYDIKGTDHPYYRVMLANFMNDALQQQYSSIDYETFINSCALADSMVLPLYTAYSAFKFTSRIEVDNFIAALNGVNSDYSFNGAYRDSASVSGSDELTILVDLNSVPLNELWRYKQVLGTFIGFPSTINERLSALQPAGIIGFIYTDNDFAFSPADSAIISSSSITFSAPNTKAVWVEDKFVVRTFYNVLKSTGTQPYEISRAIYELTAYLYNHGTPGVVFVPEYQSTINSDYFKPAKRQYLAHTYGFQSLPDYDVLDSLQAQNIIARIPEYLPYNALYSSTAGYGLFTNLYLWNGGMNDRYFDTLQHIIDQVSPSGSLFTTTGSMPIISSGSTELNAYLCSDLSYWYRYFTTGDTMFNVYLAFPKYIPWNTRAEYQVAGPVIPMPGDSLNRHFAINVVRPGASDTVQLNGLATFVIGRSIELDNVLMKLLPTGHTQPIDTFDNCERQTLTSAINDGKVRYQQYIDSVRSAIEGGLRRHLATAVQEQFIITSAKAQQSYTLYNYDRAGNLISTIPPAGVTPLPADDLGIIAAVDHARETGSGGAPSPTYSKINKYSYTSFNQVSEQTTINGGRTRFFYDAAGRLVFSQNAKQAPEGNFTYNIYDAEGRIEETGQAALGCPYFTPYVTDDLSSAPHCFHRYRIRSGGHAGLHDSVLVSPDPPEITDISIIDDYSVIVDFIRAQDRTDVVYTKYDESSNRLDTIRGFEAQQNLHKRVAGVKYFTSLEAADTGYYNYNYATHYSYDPQGNVQTLVHDYPALSPVKHRYTRIDYDYDVISGKVNMLSYNRGSSDQFYQHYSYDADNRITEVETSSDGYIWKKNARYKYYDHGPLARVELGDMRVQGMDYAYTVQGWLKELNSDTLNTFMDVGEDGQPGSITAYDAVAHTIDYFTQDYSAITGREIQHSTPVVRSLYNGNIARQTVAMDSFVKLHREYVYDQLNRIIKADYAYVDPSTGGLLGINDFHSRYSYDKDGNIQTLLRYGNNLGSGAQAMDSMSYFYADLHNDKLTDVYDESPDVYTNDIRQSPAASAVPGVGRYEYDAIGNTTSDLVSGQTAISWNLYNKVVQAVSDTGILSFEYDAMGNRVAKHHMYMTSAGRISNDEYYVHDASGNILATYKGKLGTSAAVTSSGGTTAGSGADNRIDFALAEHNIYGSSRIGTRQYYGDEVGGYIDEPAGEADTVRLYERVPWYSLEYQEVIKPDSTSPYSNIYTNPYYTRHLVGLKQYELDDHLGNVLATVSDKRAGYLFGPLPGSPPLSVGDPALIKAWKPIVMSEQDYYPFGSYMPGRYKHDTATHCIITNVSTMLPHVLGRTIPAATAMADITAYGAGSVFLSGGVLTLSASSGSAGTGSPDGMYYSASISAAGTTLSYYLVSYTADFNIYVQDVASGLVIGSASVTSSSPSGLLPITLASTHGNDVVVQVECVTATGGNILLSSFQIPVDTVVSHNIAMNLCNNDFYRYGFNGKMKDNEWAGVGNHLDFGGRIYDPRISRWLSVDPKAYKYSSFSPYIFAANDPILFVDQDGNEIQIRSLIDIKSNGKPVFVTVTYKNGQLYEDGKKYEGKNAYILGMASKLNEIKRENSDVNTMISTLEEPGKIHTIQDVDHRPNLGGDRNQTSEPLKDGGSFVLMGSMTAPEVITHELKHSYDSHIGKEVYLLDGKSYNRFDQVDGVAAWEIEAVQMENATRSSSGKGVKEAYGGHKIKCENRYMNTTTLSNNKPNSSIGHTTEKSTSKATKSEVTNEKK